MTHVSPILCGDASGARSGPDRQSCRLGGHDRLPAKRPQQSAGGHEPRGALAAARPHPGAEGAEGRGPGLFSPSGVTWPSGSPRTRGLCCPPCCFALRNSQDSARPDGAWASSFTSLIGHGRFCLPPGRGPAHGDKAADASSSQELAELCTLPGSSRRLCRDHKGPAFQLGKGVSREGPGEGAGTGLAPAAFCSAQLTGPRRAFGCFLFRVKRNEQITLPPYTHTHTRIYMYMYMYVYMCVYI